MKSIIWVFKSISVLERTVESASIEALQDVVKFRLNCRHDVVKTFSVYLLDGKDFRLDASDQHHSCCFAASARTLNEAVVNFLANQEEVTMTASADKFSLRNHVDPLDDGLKPVRTELTMKPTDFEEYEVEEKGENDNNNCMTFCLKELRALIAFAEAFKLTVEAKFDRAGSPLLFGLAWPAHCEATLVMATMSDDNDGQYRRNNATTSQISEATTKVTSTMRADLGPSRFCASSSPAVSSIGLPGALLAGDKAGNISALDSTQVSSLARSLARWPQAQYAQRRRRRRRSSRHLKL